jgi:hypothetical protein
MNGAVRVATPVPQVRKTERKFADRDRVFYVIAAVTMLIFTAGGFRRFYLHGKAPWGDITHQILPLVVLHGLVMSAWVMLFLAQSTLIVLGYRRIHMQVLGRAGAILAPLVVIVGTAGAASSVHFRPEIYAPIGGPRFFLAMMLMQLACFAAFVGIGLANRRRPEIHRPMMLLATIAMMSAPMGRFPYTEVLGFRPPLYVMGPPLLLGALLLLVQWAMSKALNRWYLAGLAGITTASFLSVAVGNSTVWNHLVSGFVP